MSRATDSAVDELHRLTAEIIVQQLRAFHRGDLVDEEGEPVRMIPPALLGQAIKFLKDNGIDAPARGAAVKDSLAGTLPSFEAVADEHGLPN